MKELEIIQYPRIQGMNLFFNTVEYRTAHFHPDWELLWLLEENLSVVVENGGFQLQPGQMALFAPNEPHEFHKQDREATFVCLQLSAQVLPFLPPLALEANSLRAFAGEETQDKLRRAMGELVRAYFDTGDPLFCMGKSLLLLQNILQYLPHHPLSAAEAAGRETRNARLGRLIRYVDENYMHKIRLSDFAEQEGCSMGYLSRFIKRTMNQSFQEYVGKVRFHAACQLIAEGNLQMLDVCFESGFSDYRYFSRAFQQRYQMTPEQFSHCQNQEPEKLPVYHRSLHSVERFYSEGESKALIRKYLSADSQMA